MRAKWPTTFVPHSLSYSTQKEQKSEEERRGEERGRSIPEEYERRYSLT